MSSRFGVPSVLTGSLAYLEPLVVAVAVILGGLSFAGFYGSSGWLAPLAGAVVLGAVAGAVSSARRWPAWLVAAVAAGLFLAYALYACYAHLTVYGLPGPAALRALEDGLMSGWARMLTVALPADVTGDLLTTPLALAFAAGLAGSLLALRTRAVTALALPPLLLFGAGLLFTAELPQPRLLLTGLVMMAVLVVLLVRSNRITAAAQEGIAERDAAAVGLDLAAQRWHSTLGRLAFGLPVVGAVAVVGTAAAGVLPIADGSDRFDVRDLREEHFRVAATLTPLVRVKPQLMDKQPDRLLTVRVSQHGGKVPVDRVRVAALDSFDGALWTQSRDFIVAGSTLPKGDSLDQPVVTVQLDVDVTRLPEPFLPVVGTPVQVAGAGVAFDAANGTLVSTRPAVSSYHYRMAGEVRPLDKSLSQARPSQTPEDAAYTALPKAPSWVRTVADRVTSGRRTPMTQLLAIETYLRAQGYDLSAPPGHSYGAVRRALLQDRAGHAEQFASAFAMLARAKDYPARVAVGYRLQPESRRGGRYEVKSGDAHAWPEVHLAGFGWVPFEPTNTRNAKTAKPPRANSAPLLPRQADRPQVREPQAAAPERGNETGESAIATATRVGLLVLGAVLLALVLVLLTILLVKTIRRRRRATRGTPADRIVAAWLETTDRLRERGMGVPLTLTPVEVARQAGAGLTAPVAPQLAELALIATSAVCAPTEPPEEAATRSWEIEAGIRRALDAETPVLVRVRALLDPRPLLPRRLGTRGVSGSGRRSSTGQRAKVPVGTSEKG
jgi:transglutaminase-like putative cysteine protease